MDNTYLNKLNWLVNITLVLAVIDIVSCIPILRYCIGGLGTLVIIALCIVGLVFNNQIRIMPEAVHDDQFYSKAQTVYILGIVFAVLAWIPLVGIVLNIIIAVKTWDLYKDWNQTRSQALNQ